MGSTKVVQVGKSTWDPVDVLRLNNFGIMMAYFSVGFVMSFVSTPLNVYMVEVLGAEPKMQTTMGILQTLPWSLKLIFGFLSDALPLFGMHRKPYLTIGSVLYSGSFLLYALAGINHVDFLAACMFFGTIGLIMMDVMCDTMCVERSRFESEERKGQMQSTYYSVRFGGGILGSVAGAVLYNREQWGWGLTFQQIAFINGILPFCLVTPSLFCLTEKYKKHRLANGTKIAVPFNYDTTSLSTYKSVGKQLVDLTSPDAANEETPLLLQGEHSQQIATGIRATRPTTGHLHIPHHSHRLQHHDIEANKNKGENEKVVAETKKEDSDSDGDDEIELGMQMQQMMRPSVATAGQVKSGAAGLLVEQHVQRHHHHHHMHENTNKDHQPAVSYGAVVETTPDAMTTADDDDDSESDATLLNNVYTQLNDIWETVQLKTVWRPMAFVYVFNVMQVPNVAWQSYLQLTLHFEPYILGLMVSVGSFMTFAGILAYKYLFFKISWRVLYIYSTILVTLFSLLQLVLVAQWNVKYLHMSNYFFSLGDDVISSYISGIQFLPLCIMYMKLCPEGSEGASYSMLTTFSNIAVVCSCNIGNLMAGIWDVSNSAMKENRVAGVWNLTILTSVVNVIPLVLLKLLPNSAEEQEELSKCKDKSRTGGIVFLCVLFGSIIWSFGTAVAQLIES